MDFRWNEWNLEHAQKHGVTPAEAEWVVQTARAPFPQRIGYDKWLVWGRGASDRLV